MSVSKAFFGAGDAAPELVEQLEELVAVARSDWPEVALGDAQLAAHFRRHASGDDWLYTVNASDLYLAAACTAQVPEALRLFDATFLERVPKLVAQVDSSPAFGEDVTQAVRVRLLVPVPGAEPKLAEYGGAGPLLSFVRVAAMRVALNLKRGAAEQRTTSEDSALEALRVDADPALALVRAQYAPAFKEAMREAFRALPTEQREALRLHFAGRYPGHRIATMMGVHRATVTRWLAAARVGVLEGTRRHLKAKLSLAESDVDSLIGVLRSQLDASVSWLVSPESEIQR